MKTKILVNPHGQILHQQSSTAVMPAHKQMDGLNMWVITQGFQDEATKYWDYENDSFRNRYAAPNKWSRWENKTWVEDSTMLEQHKGVQQMKLRAERNRLLDSTDWCLVQDSPITDAQKTEVRTYRQQLRDLPSSNIDIMDVEDVVWPTKPDFL